tara:strand:+ start:64 stop:690 length:627 start_codon:yes stop_codon:yes gene_type:complete
MNLNDEIKKQESLIEEINKNIDLLLNEQIIQGIKVFGKLIASLPKELYDKAFKAIEDEIGKTNDELNDNKDSLSKLNELMAKIERLESLANQLEEKKESELPYKKAVIEFKKKINLDIESLKSPEFQRNLLGTMYFKVVGLDEDSKYILLKTNSFPDTTFIKLEYKKLEPYKDQKGDVNLLYSRYKNPNLKVVEGNQQDCYFKFVELS